MKSDDGKTKADIFHRNAVYPEAQAIFSFRPKSLEEIKYDCLVVLDTNVLLAPYRVSKNSFDEIERVYKHLADKNRLFVPGQVAREFPDNRGEELKKLYQQLSRKRDYSPPELDLRLERYPLLENTPEYKEALELEKEIRSEYQKTLEKVRMRREIIGRLVNLVRRWYWDDPVTLLYKEVFTASVVRDLIFNEEEKAEIQAALVRHNQHKIPPGYKDAGKPDDGVGDLLIWRTILDIGKTQKRSVILVSGEEKSDWRYKSEKDALYVRYELVDEFRRCSDGQSFHLINLSEFLKLFGAGEDVVDETRQIENEQSRERERVITITSGHWHVHYADRLADYDLEGDHLSIKGSGGRSGDGVEAVNLQHRVGDRVSLNSSFSQHLQFGSGRITYENREYVYQSARVMGKFQSWQPEDVPFLPSGQFHFTGESELINVTDDSNQEYVSITGQFTFNGHLTGTEYAQTLFNLRLIGAGKATVQLFRSVDADGGLRYPFHSIRYQFQPATVEA